MMENYNFYSALFNKKLKGGLLEKIKKFLTLLETE